MAGWERRERVGCSEHQGGVAQGRGHQESTPSRLEAPSTAGERASDRRPAVSERNAALHTAAHCSAPTPWHGRPPRCVL